ncbi:MAG: bifunctional UDP-N-acetylglucosamine diphosphorylase/glucosamine-1-phosphate N-acetyltransferase GlmU, partial [Gallicola sp.]|nr:bifunctional UDP-N-acetylglucosamine diphosphorylase/glucosamine-1-phosphate N-acetyltransferase GlmU [Gallicola sp.]
IILAAGEGTRMKSKKSKVLHTLLNKTMISYVLDASVEAGAAKNVIIAGKNRAFLEEKIQEENVSFKTQEIGEGIPYGTGYAVSLALEEIADDDTVLILTGDIPLITGKTLKSFVDYHKDYKSIATVLTATIEDPTGYGRVVKDEQGNMLKIVEHKDCSEEELEIKEFNSGIMALQGKALKDSISKLDTDNEQGELYLTDIFEILREEGGNISTFLIDDVEEVYGINSKLQLAEAEKIMKRRVNEKFMIDGVVMEDPERTFIEPGVEIGRDTYIGSGVRIFGKTKIGESCEIFGDSFIKDSILDDEVVIKSSYIIESEIGEGTDVGPFSHLRPNSKLGKHVHIGDFVEIKKSTVGDGTKAGHLAYLGDVDLGENINISCGVIFANYDGKNKARTKVGSGSFIGSNANIVAPCEIEEEAYIAAGSTITKAVKKGELAIERGTQANIAGWVDKRKKNGKL